MPKEQSKKNVWLIPVCILAAVALIAALVFASSAERKSIVKNTLSTFFLITMCITLHGIHGASPKPYFFTINNKR